MLLYSRYPRDAQRDIASEQYSAKRLHKQSKNVAYPKAIAELKAAGTLPEPVELRQIKYLNNLIEQDHRFIKRLVKPGMGFFSRQHRIIASRAGGIVGLVHPEDAPSPLLQEYSHRKPGDLSAFHTV